MKLISAFFFVHFFSLFNVCSSSSATGLLLNSPCLLENLVDSPQCSVVFSLEYVVTEPLMEEHMKVRVSLFLCDNCNPYLNFLTIKNFIFLSLLTVPKNAYFVFLKQYLIQV